MLHTSSQLTIRVQTQFHLYEGDEARQLLLTIDKILASLEPLCLVLLTLGFGLCLEHHNSTDFMLVCKEDTPEEWFSPTQTSQ